MTLLGHLWDVIIMCTSMASSGWYWSAFIFGVSRLPSRARESSKTFDSERGRKKGKNPVLLEAELAIEGCDRHGRKRFCQNNSRGKKKSGKGMERLASWLVPVGKQFPDPWEQQCRGQVSKHWSLVTSWSMGSSSFCWPHSQWQWKIVGQKLEPKKWENRSSKLKWNRSDMYDRIFPQHHQKLAAKGLDPNCSKNPAGRYRDKPVGPLANIKPGNWKHCFRQ